MSGTPVAKAIDEGNGQYGQVRRRPGIALGRREKDSYEVRDDREHERQRGQRHERLRQTEHMRLLCSGTGRGTTGRYIA